MGGRLRAQTRLREDDQAVVRKPEAIRRGAARVFAAGLVVCTLVPAGRAVAQAQEVHFTVTQPDNRAVYLQWNRAPGDTLTAAQRLDVPSMVFVTPAALGIPSSTFRLAARVAGRGAGNNFKGTPQILIGSVQDLFLASNPPVPTYPVDLAVTGAFQFGATYVGLGFSRPVNSSQAGDPQNYTFDPPLAVTGVTLQDNGQTAIFKTSSVLPVNTSYTVTVSGVSGAQGEALTGSTSTFFQTVADTVINIATVHDSIAAWLALPTPPTVNVIGQVYEPLAATGPQSVYIQDGSGRGIKLLGEGSFPGLTRRGQVAEVTGRVGTALTTHQLSSYSSQIIVSGQPPLAPRILGIDEAGLSRWEGTYIQTQAPLSRAVNDPTALTVSFTVSLSDTAFAGYQIWRSETSDTTDFILLRTYSLLDSTWTFSVNGPRIFADPDSIIPRGTERDRERNPDLPPIPGPFNGFAYYYAITWFDAWIEPNSSPINYTIFQRQDKSQGMMAEPVYPGKSARAQVPLLGNVKVVPNPYNPKGTAGQQVFPGPPRVQFINLPGKATVDIYTSSGDLVRTLKHDSDNDFIDWDLKNNDGKETTSGIYFFHVEASGETATGRFVIVR
jgi:hypothetical protein